MVFLFISVTSRYLYYITVIKYTNLENTGPIWNGKSAIGFTALFPYFNSASQPSTSGKCYFPTGSLANWSPVTSPLTINNYYVMAHVLDSSTVKCIVYDNIFSKIINASTAKVANLTMKDLCIGMDSPPASGFIYANIYEMIFYRYEFQVADIDTKVKLL